MRIRNHFTWSTEVDDHKCPKCGRATVLVVAPLNWDVDSEAKAEERDVEMDDEITGHFCLKCGRLRSLSLNTSEEKGNS